MYSQHFHKIYWLKFSFKFINFFRSYAGKQKWLFFMGHNAVAVLQCNWLGLVML